MFTGIITSIGLIKAISSIDSGSNFIISAPKEIKKLNLGSSISCNGVCLTVTKIENDNFSVDISNETLRSTNLKEMNIGNGINLEPCLKAGDELGGHIVTGHVDTVVKVLNISQDGFSRKLDIALPKEYSKLIASKGSVTLDGVSLTVNEVNSNYFSVNIIPYTWENTIFKELRIGGSLNLEIDILARYITKYVK